jgi:phosphoadenosine phosphosulfate reductase
MKENFLAEIKIAEQQLAAFRDAGLSVYASTSLQTNSVVLLHLISEIDKKIPVYFINTGFLFSETLTFRQQLMERLGINIIELRPAVPKSQQRDSNNVFLYGTDPDSCCHINKVQPMAHILAAHDVWISGVRAAQTSVRAGFEVVQATKNGKKRYHPILHFTNKMVYDYIRAFNLPKHPLEDAGYVSIGCAPCTQKYADLLQETERTGRWAGMKKTECGLHTELK